VSVTIRQTPEEVLAIVTSLSGIPLDTLQSTTQLRSVGQMRAAAAHLLRTHCRLPVKDVAPLLARSDQTVCECSRKARLALVTGGRIAELIEQTRVVLDDGAADTSAPHTAEAESRDGETVDRAANYADPSPLPAPRSIPAISLRHWRTQAGLTQPQLGARAGVARETIARIENGRPATRPVVFRLAEALQIAPSMLTGITDLATLTGETYKTCNRCAAVKPLAGFIRILWNQKSRVFPSSLQQFFNGTAQPAARKLGERDEACRGRLPRSRPGGGLHIMETFDELLHGRGTIFNCNPFVIGQRNLHQHPL
jgi:transcriptional regulator with XRE-family HTH domain